MPYLRHPEKPVDEALAAGRPALLEIDLQGARQVGRRSGRLFVFLGPPSWDEMVRRLVGRGTESAEEQGAGWRPQTGQLAAEQEFDVTVINDDVRWAAQELVSFSVPRSPTPASAAR